MRIHLAKRFLLPKMKYHGLGMKRGEKGRRIRNGELCLADTYEIETACIVLSALNVFLSLTLVLSAYQLGKRPAEDSSRMFGHKVGRLSIENKADDNKVTLPITESELAG